MSHDQQSCWKMIFQRMARITRPIQVIVSERALSLCARVLALMSMCALIGVALVIHGSSNAFALQAEPTADWNYYIYANDTTTAYNLGCGQGTYDANHSSVNSEVILAFGGEYSDSGGTKSYVGGAPLTNAVIESIAVAFADGYWVCTASDSTSILTLGIGTNNSYSGVSYAGGQSWANMVGEARNTIAADGYSSQVTTDGANDIEPDWWNPGDTSSWSQGYASVQNGPYIDFGSADGCSWTTSDNTAYCNNGWTQYDVWYVSWGSPPALALPEIYYSVNATQWALISLYGAQSQSSAILMQGPLDDYCLDNSSLTPASSWYYLWTDLNRNSSTAQNMPYATEMHPNTNYGAC